MLDDRRMFLALADAGSFARTARRLDVSRSTVMRRLDALEAELDITLVHRVGRRVALTDAGRRYAEGLRPVFERLERVEQGLHEAEGRLTGRLRMALPFLGASRFMTPAFAGFQRANPGVVLELELARDIRHLEPGTFDVALQYGTRFNPDLRAQQLYREQLILCASADYVSACGVPKTGAELLEHRVISMRDLEGRRVPWRLLDGSRVELPPPVAVTNSTEVAFELMLEGVGIARLPRLLAAQPLATGEAVQVLDDIVSEAPIMFVYPRDPTPVARAFLAFMSGRAEQAVS